MFSVIKNLYITERTYIYETPTFKSKPLQIRCSKNSDVILAELHPKGLLYVYKGYSFDGCTPKFEVKVFGKRFIVGTSDGGIGEDGYPVLFHASLKHDVLCQLYKLKGFPFTRKVIDTEFKKDMKKVKWSWRGVYYSAVRLYATLKRYK